MSTTKLRLTQTDLGADGYRIEIEVDGDGFARQTATSQFHFALNPQDRIYLRWYLEDFLLYPQDPAPNVAAGVEKRMTEIGKDLFNHVFQSRDATKLWARLQDKLISTRIEIATTIEGATDIPWELIRDPDTDAPLALRAPAFVRAHTSPAQPTYVPKGDAGPIRILIVICRPGGDEDVPFRSVASRLIKGLGEDARKLFQLDMLRPPTFAQLGKTLREAKAAGNPYHVMHFDGHGMYANVVESSAVSESLKRAIPFMLSGPREGAHGYLLFENPDSPENAQLVDGPGLGKLLVDTQVPVLVLNACRSAHADVALAPEEVKLDDEDPHAKVRALGSLALEVMDAGVAGVVAMRYNVYVVTAAQFVADLYAALVRGQTLGEAVTRGRQQLAANPAREIAFDPRPLQDWPVPVVYEAAPIALFPKSDDTAPLTITLEDAGDGAGLDPALPRRPDAGFYGRDGTLLALDRAFDTESVVLLHAFAGSGKTATAAEFARWYHMTNGLDGGRVLFTSFERKTTLRDALGHFGQVFAPALERSGIPWSAIIDTAQMRDVALQVLSQVPVLWIWDNVEPVAGFPAGVESDWSDGEQRELVDFLRDARDTRARFLLTSRRDETEWLGDLPRRIAVPRMPMPDRVQLTRALAEKHNRRVTDVDDWRPLLEFTQGNPLTITALVGQAQLYRLKTKEDIEAFVGRLRAGEAAFDDEPAQGRSKSLSASLSYGFEHAFDEKQRKQLALLHLFQGFVGARSLQLMGEPKADWCVPEVRGLTRDDAVALLDQAAEVGLLTALGGGFYDIHPALPWFFKGLFDKHYPPEPDSGGKNARLETQRAFVEAMGVLGDYLHNDYEEINQALIVDIMAEESNLLYARQLSRANAWWNPILGTMQGLRSLYRHTGRHGKWRQLVEEIVPDFVDSKSDGPLPGKEKYWSLVTEYRVRLAMKALDWAEAERLQHVCVDWDRQRASDALARRPDALGQAERELIRTLAVSLERLGSIQREQGQSDCVGLYEKALSLYNQIRDQAGAAVCSFNLGHAYKDLETIRDLNLAETWYQRTMSMLKEGQGRSRAQCLGELGRVAFERFRQAATAGKSKPEQNEHLSDARRLSHQALDLFPENAVEGLAVTHNALGNVYGQLGDLDRALDHFREAIRYREIQRDLLYAGRVRSNVALFLHDARRSSEAREYALAALRNFETYGPRAAHWVGKTQKLVANIEAALEQRRD
ncbi:MAG TPA: CHAT domain-containing protein [Candidatus Hydrogenedentes bacterium]|nr:CHAT domain-containing protein [Candidatus Hydrogenedentota bacterium]